MAGSPPMTPASSHVPRRAPIVKPARPWTIEPNLSDYAAERERFSWESARRALDGLPGGRGLNIAHEAVDRHAAGPLGRHGRDPVARTRGRAPARSPTSTFGGRPTASPTCCVGWAWARAMSWRPCWAHPGALHRRARHAQERQRLHAAVFRVRTGPDRGASDQGARRGAGDDRIALPTEGATGSGAAARSRARAARSGDVGAASLGDVRSRCASGRGRRPIRDPTDRSAGSRAAALHERDDGHAERCHARPRGRGRALRDGALRARLPSGRRVLVHGGSGLGHRHVVRHHRAADARPDQHRRRSRLRRASAGIGSCATSR